METVTLKVLILNCVVCIGYLRGSVYVVSDSVHQGFSKKKKKKTPGALKIQQHKEACVPALAGASAFTHLAPHLVS